jgi:hypothetical protein
LAGLHLTHVGNLAEWSQSVHRSVWPHVWRALRSPGRQGWATIVQMLGAFVTFAGLGTAWLRAKYNATVTALAKRLLRRVAEKLGFPRNAVIYPVGINSVAVVGGAASVFVTMSLDHLKTLSPWDQIEHIARFTNNLAGETIPQLERSIGELRGKITEARTHAGNLAEETAARMQEQIDRLERELSTKQVLDLRWAIGGVLISLVGTALSYGA